ncbi:MAG: hypothetical protein AB7F75_07545 [Planctomycetota bacterium]
MSVTTGLMPWLVGGAKAWQLGLVWVEKSQRGRGFFHSLLKALFANLNDGRSLAGPLYTLPNEASAPTLSTFLEWNLRREVPRHVLKLKSPGRGTTRGQAIQELSPFLHWRFGGEHPWHQAEGGCVWREEPARPGVVQVGRWPESEEACRQSVVTLSGLTGVRQIEWASEQAAAASPTDSFLHRLGFRTRFLWKRTHRNLLLSTDPGFPPISREHFDT